MVAFQYTTNQLDFKVLGWEINFSLQSTLIYVDEDELEVHIPYLAIRFDMSRSFSCQYGSGLKSITTNDALVLLKITI